MEVGTTMEVGKNIWQIVSRQPNQGHIFLKQNFLAKKNIFGVDSGDGCTQK